MKYYGYARISTSHQRITRQIDNIKKAYPDAVVIEEIFTGTKVVGRSAWNSLYKRIKTERAAGEEITLIFDEVSRLSRGDPEEGFQLYEELFLLGVHLVFLKEPHINSDTYRKTMESQLKIEEIPDQDANDLIQAIAAALNKYILALAKKQIFLAFKTASDEVEYLHKRTAEGIAQAKVKGRRVGTEPGRKLITKKSIEAKKQIREKSKTFGGQISDTDLIKILSIDKNTYYKYKRELQEECGVTAEEIISMGTVYPTVAYCSEVIYLYAAKNLKKTQQNLDEGEFLSVEKIKISDAADMVMKGEISDSKTVALVLKVAKLKEEGKL